MNFAHAMIAGVHDNNNLVWVDNENINKSTNVNGVNPNEVVGISIILTPKSFNWKKTSLTMSKTTNKTWLMRQNAPKTMKSKKTKKKSMMPI
jgi:hypothetical protein